MIGRGHKIGPLEPVDLWLDEAGQETHRRIRSVHAQLVGRHEVTVLTGLARAGVTGPPDALHGLARRISSTSAWTLAPEGTEFRDAKGRRHRITNTSELHIGGEFPDPE
jgi:hypothetical protein